MIRCALDCCFRMYEIPGNPNWLTDVFAGDDLDDPADYAVCTATREEWEREIATGDDPDDDEYIGGGCVPVDCPIYQGEVTPDVASHDARPVVRVRVGAAPEGAGEGKTWSVPTGCEDIAVDIEVEKGA